MQDLLPVRRGPTPCGNSCVRVAGRWHIAQHVMQQNLLLFRLPQQRFHMRIHGVGQVRIDNPLRLTA